MSGLGTDKLYPNYPNYPNHPNSLGMFQTKADKPILYSYSMPILI